MGRAAFLPTSGDLGVIPSLILGELRGEGVHRRPIPADGSV
jgi:hypothetical protein